jgi:hypothetical protein
MNAHAETPEREAGQAGAQPDEAQLRAAYEAELSRITSIDMVLQAAASLLNIGAHRLGLTGGDPAQREGADRHGDLEQVRDAIDAVRGMLPVIERRAATELRPLRDALSQLQMAYTSAVQALSGAAQAEGAAPPAGAGASPAVDSAGKPTDPAGGGATPGGGDAPGDKARQEQHRGPGPAEASGRLWVPGR